MVINHESVHLSDVADWMRYIEASDPIGRGGVFCIELRDRSEDGSALGPDVLRAIWNEVHERFGGEAGLGFLGPERAFAVTAEESQWTTVAAGIIEAATQLPLFKPTILAAQPFCQDGSRYRLYRAYTNYSSFGDMLFSHTDCLPDPREITALWFIASDWDPEWGGETLFFNQDMDAEFAGEYSVSRMSA